MLVLILCTVQITRGRTAIAGKPDEKKTAKKLTISELASEFGVTPRTIRYYEEKGLLQPHRDTPTSQRLYDDRDRARLKLILRGKRFGYSLAELEDILELYDVDPSQSKQIKRTLEYGIQHIQEIDERVDELLEIRAEMLEFAKEFLEILKKNPAEQDKDGKEFISVAEDIIERLDKRK